MLIAADVGNSSLKLGFFPGDSPAAVVRVPWPDLSAAGSLDEVLPGAPPGAPLVAVSVNAGGLAALRAWAARPVLVIGEDVPLPVPNRYRRPSEVGRDRLVNAAAAHALAGGAAVVADLGSAVTVDAVGADGAFLGGAIAPGLPALRAGLRAAAPALPPWDGAGPAGGLPGSTAEALGWGILLGLAGAVERLAREARRHAGAGAPLVLCGGDAARVAPFVGEPVRLAPHLTLVGVRLLGAGREGAPCT